MTKRCNRCHHIPCVCIEEPICDLTIEIDQDILTAIEETKGADTTVAQQAATILKEYAVKRHYPQAQGRHAWMSR